MIAGVNTSDQTVVATYWERLSADHVIVQVGDNKPVMEKIFHETDMGILCNDLVTYIDFNETKLKEFE